MIAGRTRDALARRLICDPRARVAVAVLVSLIVIAAFAPLLSPYDPKSQLDIVALRSQPPSAQHLFGTDTFSRDVLSRMIHGARVSLVIAALSVTLSITIGVLVGATAGFLGGTVDTVLMRFVDGALSVPRLLLILVVVALWQHIGVGVLTLLLGLTGWFGVSRLVRAETLSVRERDFVLAARALGSGPARILQQHILPNVVGPALVAAALGIGNVILLEAGLSFLGIGVRPPTPSWGAIIQDGAERVGELWWMTLFPGLAILVTVFACNALADALRDALDPRQLPYDSSAQRQAPQA